MFGGVGNFIASGISQIASWMHEEEMQEDAQVHSTTQLGYNQAFNSAEALAQRNWQEKMRGSQYQTAVSDLRAAGLNPALAYQQGGAGVPSGGMASSSGGGATGTSSSPFNMSQILVNSALAGKIDAERTNVEADTKLKLEGQLPELLQRVLTGKASASELDARRKVLEQEFRVLEERLKWLPLMQQFETEKLSYEVMEKLKAFQSDYPGIQKQIIEAKLLGLKVPEGLAEAAFWSEEGRPAAYFRHAPKSLVGAMSGAGGGVARDLIEFLKKIRGADVEKFLGGK